MTEKKSLMKEIIHSRRKLLFCLMVLALVITGCSDKEQFIVDNTTTYEYTVTAQTSGTTNDLRSIFFVDSKKGWAVGAGGTILHTANGGATWSPQNSNTGSTLSSVYFIDADTGWVAGDNGTIRYTSNGGSTWDTFRPDSEVFLTDVAFTDGLRGWVVGVGVILKTSDGGDHWQERKMPDTVIYAVSFPDRMNGWAVAMYYPDNTLHDVFILHTDDGGQSWTPQESGAYTPLYDVAFVDALHGWAVGVVSLGAKIFHTSDGGAKWEKQDAISNSNLLGVAFWDVHIGIAVGRDGTTRTTVNGGDSWTIVSNNVTTSLEKVAFGDADNAWIVGDSGVILKVNRITVKEEK
jgi:photosystem II stability/assembly factor-like uncharacterized protein